MSNVEDIQKNKPHQNAKALCLAMVWRADHLVPCFKQWVATFPVGTNTTKLQCPACNAQESFASLLPCEDHKFLDGGDKNHGH